MKLALPAAALVVAGGAAIVLCPTLLRAADESAQDAVERLMPQLMSDDDTTRADAERRLFELGESGRAELERVTRETDPRRAITALRLLQSPKWPRSAPTKSGELRVYRDRADAPSDDDPFAGIRSLRAQMEEMRRRFEQFDRGFQIPWPDIDISAGGPHGRSSGKIVENDRSTEWTIEDDGRVKVTVRDGKDAPEQTFEAKDVAELEKDHPEIAKRLKPMIDGGQGRSFSFRFAPRMHDWMRGRDGGREGAGLTPFDAPQAPVLGIEWAPVPDVLREHLDVGQGGMVVESVVPGSLAETLGLARHDILLEIGGRAVAGGADVRAALESAKAGDKVAAVILRKGQRKPLETTK
jgi:hypothetical protein